MTRTHSLFHRSVHAALAAVLTVGMLMPSVAFADPAPEAKPGAPGEAAPGEDAQLYSCHKKSGMTTATFKPDTELKDLISWVMGFTCKNFIFDPRIVSTGKKVTVMAPLKMTVGEAYRVFLVALSTMGLTVVPKGNALRIVESASAKSETVPIYHKGVPPDDDQIIRYVLRPSYAPVETIRQALDAIRSQAGVVSTAGTMLIITDYASQVRDMMTMAKALDIPGNNDGINTISVRHADATQLAQKLNDILGLTASAATAGGPVNGKGAPRPANPPAGGGAQQVNTDDVSVAVPSKILVDERTNTLIVVASEAGYLRVKALVDRLDISLDTEGGSAIHVYPLENALAEELATTLNNAMQGQQAKAGAKPGQPGAPAQAAPTPAPGAVPGDASNLGAALEGQVRVIGDKPTNSLIVVSTGRDFLAIKDVIRRLDLPRRQVFIEALILEVQLSNETDIGSSSHGGLPISGGQSLVLGGVQTGTLSSLNPASLATATGIVGGLLGSPLANSTTFLGTSIPSYGVLFQALSKQANTNILSTPVVIALDNEKAEFSVGNNIPYKAGLSFGGFGLPTSGTAGAASSGIAGSIGQNIQRQKLNLTLNITPHISSNDAVRLEVEQEDEDIGDKDPELGPTWTERKLHTHVVVHDQQSVVIGGLIQEREIFNVTKVPLLGDIPLLGYLFKYQTKTKKKTDLLIMLTPYIIKDQLDLAAIRARKTREYDEFTKSFTNLNALAYEPRVDYKRKRGVVEEINRSVLSVELDQELRNQIGHRQHVQDGPIDYTPSQMEAPEEGAGHGDGTSHGNPPDGGDMKKPTPPVQNPAPAPAPTPQPTKAP